MNNTPEYGDPMIHRPLHQQYLEPAPRRNVSPAPDDYYDQLWWDPNTANHTADETVVEETSGYSGTPGQAKQIEEEGGEVLTIPHLGKIGTKPDESSWWEHLEDEEGDMLSDTISSSTLPDDFKHCRRAGPELQVGAKLDSGSSASLDTLSANILRPDHTSRAILGHHTAPEIFGATSNSTEQSADLLGGSGRAGFLLGPRSPTEALISASSTAGTTDRTLLPQQRKDLKSIDTACHLSHALEQVGICFTLLSNQYCTTEYTSGPEGLCTRHEVIYNALVTGSTPPPNLGATEVVRSEGSQEENMVFSSPLWDPKRAHRIGQYQPPPGAWSTEYGEILWENHFTPTRMLRSTRKAQLRVLKEEHHYVESLRLHFPTSCQPYPLYWPASVPLPETGDPPVTLTWDLISNLDVPYGLHGLEATSLIAVARFSSRDWEAIKSDPDGAIPALAKGVEVCLREVDSFKESGPNCWMLNLLDPDHSTTSRSSACFDKAHLLRIIRDYKSYLEWCVEWHSKQVLGLMDSENSDELDCEVFIAGRIPKELTNKYCEWTGGWRSDLGLGTKLLRILHNDEYLSRKDLADRIVRAEQEEMESYGIATVHSKVAIPPKPTPQFVESPVLGPTSHSRPLAKPSASTFPTTPGSALVRKADPRLAREQAQALSAELFSTLPEPSTSPRDARSVHPSVHGFRTPQRFQTQKDFTTPARPSPLGVKISSPFSQVVKRGTNASTPPSFTGRSSIKKPLPRVPNSPEMDRAEALIRLRDSPSLANTISRRPPIDPRLLNTPVRENLSAIPRIPPTGTANPAGGQSTPPPPTSPLTRGTIDAELNLEAESAEEGRGAPPGTTAPDHTAAWALEHAGAIGENAMVRIAIATEAKVFLKAQSDVYKDLNMVELQTEMLTNPAMGIISAMLPSVYHIKGVSGHFNLTLANMNGTSRFRVLYKHFLSSVFWTDPELVTKLRIKFLPRLLMVLSFTMFRGPMALHAADISVVPESELMNSLTPHYHFGGKQLPISGNMKLTPPDLSKLGSDLVLVWEQLEHLIQFFVYLYGENHREPLNRLVLDIKDIQRNDYGYTNLEAANLFTRTLGYHQDLICEAFATGNLSHIKSQEDLIHELESSGGERDLLLRIPNLPRLLPGQRAYQELYENPRNFFLRLNVDQGVRLLRESTTATSHKPVRRPPSRFGGGEAGTHLDLEDLDEVPQELDGYYGSGDSPKPKPPPGPAAPKRTPRSSFPRINADWLSRGLRAMVDLQNSLTQAELLPSDKEICLRFLSHSGCSGKLNTGRPCQRAHLSTKDLSGITLSPALKVLLVTHQGYRGEPLITEKNAPSRLLKLQQAAEV